MKPIRNPFAAALVRNLILTGTLAIASARSDAGILLQYRMGQVGPQTQGPVTGAGGGNLTAAAGLATFNPLATLTYTSAPVLQVNPTLANTPVSPTTLATALTNNSFFTFTLTVGSGVASDLDLSSLSFNAARGGTGVARGYGVYVTTPTTTDELIQPATDLLTVRPNWTLQTINLSSITSLQNLTPGQVVTFKIPVYVAANNTSVDFDDITVEGTGGSADVVDVAGTRTKANNVDNLNLLSSWSTGLPASTDVVQWADNIFGANSTLLGANLSWQGIRILSPGGLVTIAGPNTVTLGNSGIAMGAATQDLTIGSGLTLGTGNQSWDVATGRTLTLNTGAFTRSLGSTLNLPGVGTVTSTMTNLSTNTAGIVGTWASTGTAAATRYATFTGASIGALTGTAAADGAALTDTLGTANYDLATFGGTVPAVASSNTIRYAGAEGATAPGATSFAVNGLMNVGTGTWTLGTAPLTIGANKELVVNTAVSDITISSAIANNAGGASALTKVGSGLLTLSGVNSYTGLTSINTGTLDVGPLATGSLGAGGLLFNTDTVLQGSGTFTRNFSGTATAAAGQISGLAGGFAARGAPLIVNLGGSSASVSLSSNVTTPTFGSNFILGSTTANNHVTVQNPIDLNGAVRTLTAITGAGGDSNEFSGVISGTSPAGINKRGNGQLILSAANTYTGSTTVSTGMLVITNPNGLGATASGGTNTTSVTSGGSLQLRGTMTSDPNEALTISGSGSTNVGALQADAGNVNWTGPITLGAIAARIGATAGNTLTVTGSIASGTTTSLSVSGGGGTGVIVLNPIIPNTYTGSTLIARGILRLGKNDAIPITSVLDAKNVAGDPDAATFDLAGFNQTLAGLTDLDTVVVNDTITNSSATTSTLTLNTAVAATFDGTIVDGAGTITLVKNGTATQTLAGSSSFTGNTLVNVGGLSIRSGTALGDTTGITTVAVTGTTATGGRLILGNNISCDEKITLTGSSEITGFNPSIDSNSGSNSLNGNITLSGTGGQRISVTAGTLDVNAPIARDGANSGILVLRTSVTDATLTVNNSIDLNGSGINIQGLGTVLLTSPSTDISSATIGFGGPFLTLKLGITNALPATADLSIGTTNNATLGTDQGNFDLAGYSQTVRALTGFRGTVLAPSDATLRKITNSSSDPSVLTVGNTTISASTNIFDGVIEDGFGGGGVSLIKEGAGTLVLSEPNTYTGATSVTGGDLRISGTGSLAGTAVTVGAAGTLSGSGTIAGTVTSSGTIAPGNAGVGTLTTGAAGLTGTLAVEIDGATGDKLVSTGAVSLSGALTVSLLGGGFTLPSYVIAEGTSLTGTFSSVPSGYTVTYSATQATLTQGTVSDYDTWATSFGLQNPWLGINPALNGTSTADPDGDGMKNQQEYAFGLIPTSGSSVNPITIQLNKTTGTFSYNRRATPAATGLVYTVKTSPDLVIWTTDVTATATQSVTATVGQVQTVQVTLTGAPLTAAKTFVRVQAQ